MRDEKYNRMAKVPEGKILVVPPYAIPKKDNPELFLGVGFYRASIQGEELMEYCFEIGSILNDGESMEVSQKTYVHGDPRYYPHGFRNQNGKVVEFDPLNDEKKAYAKTKAEELKSLGLRHDQAWKILKACGPGYISQTIAYANSLRESGHSPDLIWLIFGGAKGTSEEYGFGYSRTIEALREAGIKPPEIGTWSGLYRILKGARLLVRVLPFTG